MFNIRLYTSKDYEMICSWWKEANEPSPSLDQLPLETTFIVEIENEPAVCTSLYLTNCKQVSWMSGLVGNPKLKGNNRKEATKILIDAVWNFAKAFGYKNVICFAYKDKLKAYYEELGYTPTLSNMQGFIRKVS